MLLDFDKIRQIIQKLAKNNYWQTIYSQSKELSGVNVFRNVDDFSHIQIEFLNNLSFYNNLYFEVAMGDVSDIIFKDDIYADAYYYFKINEKNKKNKVSELTEPQVVLKKNNQVTKEQIKEQDKFIFRLKDK